MSYVYTVILSKFFWITTSTTRFSSHLYGVTKYGYSGPLCNYARRISLLLYTNRLKAREKNSGSNNCLSPQTKQKTYLLHNKIHLYDARTKKVTGVLFSYGHRSLILYHDFCTNNTGIINNFC